jgi:GH25 family lysozyme M1 (1,4-beta-N-acetylmuramidase)
MTEIFGIDAASFQGNVDWTSVDSICEFGWEKVTQGTGYENPYWPRQKNAMLARAKASGFVPGAYMFLEHNNGAAQADYFASKAGNLDGFLVGVDAEPTQTSNPVRLDMVQAVGRLRTLYPNALIWGYPPQWYWGNTDLSFFDELWASKYPTMNQGSPSSLYSHVPASYWNSYGGKSVTMLQFTSAAIVPGLAGPVDCSAVRMTTAQLRMLTTRSVPAPKPTTVDEDNVIQGTLSGGQFAVPSWLAGTFSEIVFVAPNWNKLQSAAPAVEITVNHPASEPFVTEIKLPDGTKGFSFTYTFGSKQDVNSVVLHRTDTGAAPIGYHLNP